MKPVEEQLALIRRGVEAIVPEDELRKKLATGKPLRVLPGAYGWYQPIWSPDGTKIVVTDDRPGLGNVDGPAVRVILDVAGKAPPIVIAAPGTTPDQVPDWAASWQRLALP